MRELERKCRLQEEELGLQKEARRRAEEQARQEAGAAGDPQGGTPETDPSDAAQGGPLEQSEAEWGRLPARTREAVRQGLREKMSTTYKWWTEQYYRRIAEEARK